MMKWFDTTIFLKGFRKNWILFTALIFLTPGWILSQNISNIPDETEKTEISYYRLNEVWKFVEFEKKADSLITAKNFQIAYLDSIVNVRGLKLEQYEKVSMPALEARIRTKDSTITNQQRGFTLDLAAKEADLKAQRKKKWTFGAWGYILGIASAIAGFFVFGL